MKWFNAIWGLNGLAGISLISYLLWLALDYIPFWEKWEGKYAMLLFIWWGIFGLMNRCEKLSAKARREKQG